MPLVTRFVDILHHQQSQKRHSGLLPTSIRLMQEFPEYLYKPSLPGSPLYINSSSQLLLLRMSSIISRYKSWERSIAHTLGETSRRSWLRWYHSLASFFKAASQSISILFVFHGSRKPIGFRINNTLFVFACTIFCAMCAMTVIMAVTVFSNQSIIASASSEVQAQKQKLTTLVNQADEATTEWKRLEKELFSILGTNVKSAAQTKTAIAGATRSSLAVHRDLADASIVMDSSVPLIYELGIALGKLAEVKQEVPAIWPIKDSMGHVSTTFGYNPNPFTGQTYFHTGLDCSTYRSGDAVVATGNGRIVFSGVEGGYGRTIIMVHEHGYSSRFAHLQAIFVHTGQWVKQGQSIGLIGNTGVSTGPHVHYELHEGNALVDPMNHIWSGLATFPTASLASR